MDAVIGFVIGILAVVVAFGFIIFIHELGHFLTARAVDIRCPQFAVGFGPSLFSFRWRGTNFAVRAFPFGGYVLMNGEEPGDRTEDPWAEAVAYYLGEASFPAKPQALLDELEKIPVEERGEWWTEVHDQVAYARCEEFPTLRSVEGNFHDRSVAARILVISGGVIMNFLSAILILWCLGPLVGVGSFYDDWSPYVSQVVPEKPAAKAGIVSGDLILEVDSTEMHSFLEAFHAIGRHPGTPVTVKVRKRDGTDEVATLTPDVRVGHELYSATPEGELTLLAAQESKEKLVGKKVTSHTLQQLIEETNKLVGTKGGAYEIELDGEPYKFPLFKDYEFTGIRGQIGILFGAKDIRFEKETEGVVTAITPGSPAEKAGFQVGDQIISVDRLDVFSPQNGLLLGSRIEPAMVEVQRVPELDTILFRVLRNDEAVMLEVPKTPDLTSPEALGVTLRPMGASDVLKAPFSLIGQMLSMPYMILKVWLSNQYTGSEIVGNLQGPVGIMHMIYEFSDNGLAQFLYFVALLNAAIGAFNLLPFPALDGSRLVFLIIAGLRGKPLDPDKEAKIHLAGLMVLLGFVVIVTFGDIKRLFSSEMFVL